MLLTLGVQLGCTSNENKTPVTVSNPTNAQVDNEQQEEVEGGISAGGGGTLPANPISISQTVEVIAHSKKLLRMYLAHERKYEWGDDSTDSSRFYFGNDNLATVLEKTDIEILQDRACKDKFGRDVDGSVHASRPNTICISAFRIAPKLVEEVAAKEVLALIAHELSHLLGSNEKEAVELQESIAYTLTRAPVIEIREVEWQVESVMYSLEDLSSQKKILILDAIAKNNLALTLQRLEEFIDTLYDVQSPLDKYPLNLTDYPINDFESVLKAKIQLGLYFLRSLDSTDNLQEYFIKTYQKCFRGNSALSIDSLNSNCQLHKAKRYGNYMIPRLEKLEDLKEYLKDIFVYTQDYAQHVRAVRFNQPLPFFNLPNNQIEHNAWSKFQGKYKSSMISCTSVVDSNIHPFLGLTEVEIAPEVIHHPVENLPAISFKEIFSNRSRNDVFFNGGGGGQDMRISGDENDAVMTESRGTRWYDRNGQGWARTTKSLQHNGGDFVLSLKQEYFSYGFNGLNSSEYYCQYKLTKQE